jgi:hypothetical protein
MLAARNRRRAAPLTARPDRLAHLIIGAGTFSAFEAMDSLVNAGVPFNPATQRQEKPVSALSSHVA